MKFFRQHEEQVAAGYDLVQLGNALGVTQTRVHDAQELLTSGSLTPEQQADWQSRAAYSEQVLVVCREELAKRRGSCPTPSRCHEFGCCGECA